MDWKNKNVFITGADGFVGGWLAKSLVEKKARVFVLIRDMKMPALYKLFNLQDQVTQIQGDVADYTTIERAMNEYSIDSCFHLAAQALVQVANTSPLSTFESNIKGTWSILEACRNTKTIERVVVASSDKAYGVQKELPYTEDSPLMGLYPYDASKACADILARSYFVSFGLPVSVTRNANTYGGGDLNFSRLIPDAIRCVLKDEEFLFRSDGTPERDYMYVEDAVEGYLTLAEQMPNKEIKGQAFNFGTGKPISVNSLFKIIAKLCGRPQAAAKALGSARNEIDRQFLAIDKAQTILGWDPRYTLEEGLERTIAWYKDFLSI